MKTLDQFLTRVMPHVIGCPDVTAQQALLDTAIEFCEKTLILRQTLDPFDTEANTLEYELLSISNQELVTYPVQVWFKGTLLQPASADMIAAVQAYRTDTPGINLVTGDPTQYFWTAQRTLGLYPVPSTSETGVLTARVAVRPTRSATSLNDILYEDWVEALAAGTLARLHMTKDQPWASADRALIQHRYFKECIQRARAEAMGGRVRGSTSVRMRSF